MAGEPMNLGKMIMLFIGILIGVILISALADPIFETRNLFTTTNATTDISGNLQVTGNMTTGATVTVFDNFLKSLTVRTGNRTVLALNTDYTTTELNSATPTTITFIDTDVWAGAPGEQNDTSIDYTHGDSYVEDSTSRTFLGLILIFFAIGILAFILAKLKGVFDFFDGM